MNDNDNIINSGEWKDLSFLKEVNEIIMIG